VRALARSDASTARVASLGAEPVRGDLGDAASLERALRGTEVVFHAAAKVDEWGRWADFRAVNVEGIKALLTAAARAGARRLVHVGTEAAVLRGQPLVLADERVPLAFDSPAAYPATKAEAEAAVVSASGIETIVVRPRFVWGPGDTTLMPAMIDLVRAGRFRWISGGRHLTSTCHVDNCVEGLVLAADHGVPGSAYFVTDGAPVVFRDFITALLATRGVTPPDTSVPRFAAFAAARAAETPWRALALHGAPPLTRLAVWLAALS
jgi:nucleoside-diphosphate-sugar epimerase